MFKFMFKKPIVQVTSDRAYLVSMERAGRVNKFTFVRNGQQYTIETMGLLSDDIREWQAALLE